MTRSSNANRYGTLAERKMADKWGLKREGVHSYSQDAVDEDGTPWELKSTMATRASGSPGRFRIFERAHDELLDAGGYYGFAVYRPVGRGIQVLRMKAIPAARLPVAAWYGAGGHRDSKQTKLAIGDVF